MTQKSNRRRRRRNGGEIRLRMAAGVLVLTGVMLILGGLKLLRKGPFDNQYKEETGKTIDAIEPEIDVQLLTVNDYSRPGIESDKIEGIVIHYTANPGSTALQNRDYFEGLKDSRQTKASSHFVVGLEGEIIQCVPTWEMAYASNERNRNTVSIETCHMEKDGRYTDATYRSMVQLTAWLCKKFDLTEKDIIRHYDITGKICPKYFVDDEKAWEDFKKDVKNVLDKLKEES